MDSILLTRGQGKILALHCLVGFAYTHLFSYKFTKKSYISVVKNRYALHFIYFLNFSKVLCIICIETILILRKPT